MSTKNQIKFELISDDKKLFVKGPLNCDSIINGSSEFLKILNSINYEKLLIDLESVEDVDSAGVTGLVYWYKNALAAQKKIHFIRVPESVVNIIRVSGLDVVLPVSLSNTKPL